MTLDLNDIFPCITGGAFHVTGKTRLIAVNGSAQKHFADIFLFPQGVFPFPDLFGNGQSFFSCYTDNGDGSAGSST